MDNNCLYCGLPLDIHESTRVDGEDVKCIVKAQITANHRFVKLTGIQID